MIRNQTRVVFAATAIVLTACSGGDGETAQSTVPQTVATTPSTTSTTTSTTSTTTTTSTLPPVPPSTIPVDVLRMPLTGEPVNDVSEIPNRPALAVKIPNNSKARPQAGLNEADIVFEEIIEGEITRFAAVFHSQGTGTDPLGPIRSGRTQDINILTAFHRPLFAWSGGNGGVTYQIEHSPLIDLSAQHADGYYRRSGRHGAPHNLFSSTDALWAQAPADAEIPPVVFRYLAPGEEVTGDPASVIDVQMGGIKVHWEYDPETDRYFRWQNGSAHNTESSGQVWADNLVMYLADYQPSFVDRRSPEAGTLGSNPVVIFTGGTVRTGVWLRFQTIDPFTFFNNVDELVPLPLQPGRTFVEIPRNIEGSVTWG